MIALLVAAALQGEPNASLCSVAYAIELRRQLRELGIPSPVDPAKLTAAQRDKILSKFLSLDSFTTEGRTWVAIAFSRNETWAAIKPAFARLSRSPEDQAAAFRSCSQVKAADREPLFQEPPAPAPGLSEQCAAEDAAVHREIRVRAAADMIRAHALKAMSGLAQGVLTCRSLEVARTAWLEIGSAAAAAVGKDMDQPVAK